MNKRRSESLSISNKPRLVAKIVVTIIYTLHTLNIYQKFLAVLLSTKMYRALYLRSIVYQRYTPSKCGYEPSIETFYEIRPKRRSNTVLMR